MRLFGRGKEWIKAPIAGTMILICYAGAMIALYRHSEEFLMWMILAELLGIRRDKYLEEWDGEAV